MKRIFPIITILIFLSLLGLIFFQFLWIKSAREAKINQVEDNIARAMDVASTILSQDNTSIIPFGKKNDLVFPGSDKLQYFKPSVTQRFSKDEITQVIRNAFNQFNLKDYPFEFAIIENSINGRQLLSDNYFNLYSDSANNKKYIIPLYPPGGSNYENLVNEEFFIVIVPGQKNIVWREMFWFIMGAIFFTLIITTAFFITIRTLLKQKKVKRNKI